jgi:hypothetical protein
MFVHIDDHTTTTVACHDRSSHTRSFSQPPQHVFSSSPCALHHVLQRSHPLPFHSRFKILAQTIFFPQSHMNVCLSFHVSTLLLWPSHT